MVLRDLKLAVRWFLCRLLDAVVSFVFLAGLAGGVLYAASMSGGSTIAALITDSISTLTSGGNIVIKDSAGNTEITFFDDGTTGSLKLSGTKSRGQITLSGGTGTATVNTGAICVCDDNGALNAVNCSVSSTTLTATGTGTDTINYLCL